VFATRRLLREHSPTCNGRFSAIPTLFVPPGAVTPNLQRTFVIRVRDGKAEWVDVKTGATAGGKTEVFGDLKDGAQVVLPASDELAPGTTVLTHSAENRP
jgi:hypothetical protein